MFRSIASRLNAAFVAVLIALAAIGGLALYGFAEQSRAVGFVVEHHLQEMTVFDDIRLQIADAVHQDHDYVLTGDPAFDDAFESDLEEIERLLITHADLHRASGLTPAEVNGISSLRRAVDRYAEIQDQVDELFTAGRIADARALSSRFGRRAADVALVTIQNLVALERREGNEQLAGAAAEVDRAYRWMLIAALAVVVVTGAAALSVTRSVTVPVRRLLDATRRIDAGNLSVRTGISGANEVGELAGSFDYMVDRLEETFREQERFLADVSHELRTPITIIRGHLDVLDRGPRGPDQVTRAVAISLDELDRMGRLVNDLLLLARAMRPDFLDRERLALRPFLSGVYQKALGIAARPWRLGTLADVAAVADRDQLTQAVLNLLRNAAEHTGPTDAIELSSRQVDGIVEITVADDGEGIAAAEVPHLFERFYRGTGSDTRSGAGLGLSIVKAIAVAHGGDVRAERRAGEGTAFSILLPVAPPAQDHEQRGQ